MLILKFRASIRPLLEESNNNNQIYGVYIVKNIAFALVALLAVASTVPAAAKESAENQAPVENTEATVEQTAKNSDAKTPADAPAADEAKEAATDAPKAE